jgi:uncharacterized protein (DUF362 family)
MEAALKHHLDNLNVAIASGTKRYPAHPPFHPSQPYPEFPHREKHTDPDNEVYAMVRESFRLLRLDEANFGRREWNPLGALISPGHRVLIKPNFVLHFNAGGGALEAVVTHPSVIRAIVDYVVIALERDGEIVVGDSPQMNCDWTSLHNATGMDVLASYLQRVCAERGVKFQLVDFRQEQTFYRHGIVWNRRPLGNGARPVQVSLGTESLMEAIDSTRLYGADYCRGETVRAHAGHRHEYVIAPTVLSSDVVISVPKLKVHRKVGTTLNLKNMVGINSDKNHLAHYRVGSPGKGGDEFSNPGWDDRVERLLSDFLLGTSWRSGKYPFLAWRAFRKLFRRIKPITGSSAFAYGNWHGNDTAWRMVVDLNRILFFADREGNLQPEPARRYFSVIDGVVGGEGEGPLHPDAYASGVVLAGFNPVAVDWTATRLMGFEPAKIPLYANALRQMGEWVAGFGIEHCRVRSNVQEWESILKSEDATMRFRAPAGWRGQIERYELSSQPPAPVMSDLSILSQ